MELLPYYGNAVVPIEKVRDYALDATHQSGKHKARVFEAALGFRQEHSDILARLIKVSLSRAPAVRGAKDDHGERWTTYHEIVGANARTAVVTVAWICRTERPTEPMLISCYIEGQGVRKLTEAQNTP
jgi:hypothetical protein